MFPTDSGSAESKDSTPWPALGVLVLSSTIRPWADVVVVGISEDTRDSCQAKRGGQGEHRGPQYQRIQRFGDL